MSYAYWMSQRDEAEEWGDYGQYRMAGWYADEAAEAGNWETESEPDYEPDYDDDNGPEYEYDNEREKECHCENCLWYQINYELDRLYRDSTDFEEIKYFYYELILHAHVFKSKHNSMMSEVFDAIKAIRVDNE